MQLANKFSPGRSPPKKSKAAEPSPQKTIPCSSETLTPPHALAPPRFFHDSPPHVSFPYSPGRGTVRKDQRCAPVRTSKARTSPGAAMPGPSPLEKPRITKSSKMAGAEVGPYGSLPIGTSRSSRRSLTPIAPKLESSLPVAASIENNRPSEVPCNMRRSPFGLLSDQYASPRFTPPDASGPACGPADKGSKDQSVIPLLASSACTIRSAVVMYMTPLIIRGVHSIVLPTPFLTSPVWNRQATSSV